MLRVNGDGLIEVKPDGRPCAGSFATVEECEG